MSQEQKTASSGLTTTLSAAQCRLGISSNPVGLSESLTRKPQELPDIDFDAEISKHISDLDVSLTVYDQTKAKPNVELIEATRLVAELQAKIAAATAEMEHIQALGTPLDRLARAINVAERALVKLSGEYSKAVENELLLERFGQASNLPPSAVKDVQHHKRVQDLRHFQPLQVSSEIPLHDLGNIENFNGMTASKVRELHGQEVDAASRKNVLRRANAAGEKLDALRQHIAQIAPSKHPTINVNKLGPSRKLGFPSLYALTHYRFYHYHCITSFGKLVRRASTGAPSQVARGDG
jgi:hypothetical protein